MDTTTTLTESPFRFTEFGGGRLSVEYLCVDGVNWSVDREGRWTFLSRCVEKRNNDECAVHLLVRT